MISIKNTKVTPGAMLLLLIAFFVFLNYASLKNASNPLGKDSLGHMGCAIKVIRGFNLIAYLENPTWECVRLSIYGYPPLFYLVAAAIRIVFNNVDFMFMTSTIFLILLIYSTYKIGQVLEDRKAGLLSAAIVASYPIIYVLSRDFNLDMAQTAMVCVSLYLLIMTECFKNRKYSILFGLVSGMGMLSKHMFILFIIGPLLVTLIQLIRTANNNRNIKMQLINMIIALFILCLISLRFYYSLYFMPGTIQDLIRTIGVLSTGELNLSPGERMNIHHFLFFLKSLKLYQIGLLNLLIFLFLLPGFLLKKKYNQYRIFLMIWIILPIFLLTLRPGKYSEYTVSCLPPFAIITSLGILSISRRSVRNKLIIIILLSNIFLNISIVFPKYVDIFWSNNIFNTVFKYFKVDFAPASYDSPYNSKMKDPHYKAVKFLTELLKNKKNMIGFINYISANWPYERIKWLLLLYNNNVSYDLRNVIQDFVDQDLDIFDFFVFINAPGLTPQWLNKDYFLEDMENFNQSQRYSHRYPFCILWDGISPKPDDSMAIYQNQLERIINFYSKVKLVKKINDPRGDILIYEKMQ